jgi:hypothetical protein
MINFIESRISLVLATVFVTAVLCSAGTITVDSVDRAVQINYLPSGSGSHTVVGPHSTLMGLFNETVSIDETYPNGRAQADATQLSNITNSGNLLQVTASGSTNIARTGDTPHVDTTSDLYLTFTIDDTFYYYYSVSSTDMGRFGLDSPYTSIHGAGTFSGTIAAGTYFFDIGAWTTGGPHNEYDGTLTVSATPIPEPASLLLLSIGIGGLSLGRRCRKRP